MSGYTYEDLLAIQTADPSGGAVEPRAVDCVNHREWAINRYGLEAWKRYKQGGWGREAGDHDGGAYDGGDF